MNVLRISITGLLVICGSIALPRSAEQRTFILEGTVVTSDRILDKGWVVVRGAKIIEVAERRVEIADAVHVDTEGIVLPGLIDLHNHVVWNVSPRWRPRARYMNRAGWRNSPEYRDGIADVIGSLRKTLACEMNAYGEIRALAGGVTSILSSDTGGCLGGPVRNLEGDTELYPQLKDGRVPLRQAVDVDTIDDSQARVIADDLEANRAEAFLVHVAEGRPSDRASRDEFARLVSKGLLGKKTAVVHGTAFGDEELWAMRELGAALIWSPRSNMELYGETLDVLGVLNRGIPIALAPDWALTGSSNMLDELRYAASLNRSRFNGRLTSRELVQMVTEVPARIVGVGNKVGAVREGFYADLLVIAGNRARPYDAIIGARPEDVRLVVIGGEAVYGVVPIVERLREAKDLDTVTVCSARMAVASRSGPQVDESTRFSVAEPRLRSALTVRGSVLAPIAECTDP